MAWLWWNYDYKTLTDAEKAARRAALDNAGRSIVYAQLLLAGLLYVYLSLTRWSSARRSRVARACRRAEWRLAEPVAASRPELRCWGEWMLVVAWAACCAGIAVRNTGDDYLHLTKACALVAAANLPLHFLLALKRSPLRLLFHATYEGRANFLHRWLGRTIYTLLTLHVGLYLKFFYDSSLFGTRFLEPDILAGFLSFLLLTVLVVSSNHLLRAASYKSFYLLHIAVANSLFPLLWYHVTHLRPYLYVAAALWAWEYATRLLCRFRSTASIRLLTPHLLEISVDQEPSAQFRARHPGSHGLLRVPAVSRWTTNPFTITTPTIRSRVGYSSAPCTFVARTRGGFTRKLADLPATAWASDGGRPGKVEVVLDLPFGASLYFPPITPAEFDSVLFIAGGVGATFAVSWIRYLLLSQSGWARDEDADAEHDTNVYPGTGTASGSGRRRGGSRIRFVWAVKTAAEALWAVSPDISSDGGGAQQLAAIVELYITASGAATAAEEADDHDGGGIEMQEAGLLRRASAGGAEADADLDALVRAGVARERIVIGARPNAGAIVAETVAGRAGGDGGGGGGGGGGDGGGGGRGTAVLVCGPAGMGMAVRKACGRMVLEEGREVWLHVEEFGH